MRWRLVMRPKKYFTASLGGPVRLRALDALSGRVCVGLEHGYQQGFDGGNRASSDSRRELHRQRSAGFLQLLEQKTADGGGQSEFGHGVFVRLRLRG